MKAMEQRGKPALPRKWLHYFSGLVWTGVGLMLLRWVWTWSALVGLREIWPFNVAGLLLGAGTASFFSWMASINRERIEALPEQPCAFAFQSWWSYPLVVFMIGLGLALKASPLPRTWLSGLYLAIGGGLSFAGLRTFRLMVRRRPIANQQV
jgi:hypothetical protein